MLPDFIEVCPIQLPGKENRIKEKPFADIDRAAEVLKEVLQPELDRPYAFYGHSIGAFITYRLAYQLWKESGIKPKHLFVGAYTAPTILPNPVITIMRKKFKTIGYSDIPGPDFLSAAAPEQINEILELLGEEDGVNEELSRLLLPTRLSELKLVSSYKSIDKEIFDIPITAIHGDKDDVVTEEEMNTWNKLTTGAFKLHIVHGDHLFLRKSQTKKQVLKIISQALESYKF